MAQWHAEADGERKESLYDQARSLDKMADGKLAEVKFLSRRLREIQAAARSEGGQEGGEAKR